MIEEEEEPYLENEEFFEVDAKEIKQAMPLDNSFTFLMKKFPHLARSMNLKKSALPLRQRLIMAMKLMTRCLKNLEKNETSGVKAATVTINKQRLLRLMKIAVTLTLLAKYFLFRSVKHVMDRLFFNRRWQRRRRYLYQSQCSRATKE